MKRIVLKLADLLTLASVDMATANHVSVNRSFFKPCSFLKCYLQCWTENDYNL